MKQFILKIASFAELSEVTARSFFDFLISYQGGIYTPDKCDAYEPLKKKFKKDDYSEQLTWLLKPSGLLIFKDSKGNFLGNIENKQKAIVYVEKNGKKVPFGNAKTSFIKFEITLWVKTDAPEKLIEFFRKLYLATEGGYGFLALEEEYVEQNFIKEIIFGGNIKERFAGDNFNEYVPGVYWVNMFGDAYRDLFANVLSDNEFLLEDKKGVIFIRMHKHPEDFSSSEGLSAKKKIRSLVGGNYIFDKNNLVDTSDLYSYFQERLS